MVAIIALTVLVAGGMSALSGILVPLIIAIILGTILEPVVSWLVHHKMPRALAAILVLLAVTTLAVGIVIIVVQGFVQQLPEISKQLLNDWHHVLESLCSLNLDATWVEELRKQAADEIALLAGRGAMGLVTDAGYGAISFSIGAFFALYFLFFVLRDGRVFPAWLA